MFSTKIGLVSLVIYCQNFCTCKAIDGWGFHLSIHRVKDIEFLRNDKNFLLLVRGGGEDHEIPETLEETNVIVPEDETLSEEKVLEAEESSQFQKAIKSRHTYDMILDLRRRSSVHGNDESLALRTLITTRSRDYMRDLMEALELGNEGKLPHPKRILHYLAPKVPAIKQSPDVNLRIYSARSDMDSGVAACIIGTLAHVCEIYDKEMIKRSDYRHSVAPEIINDRRFEQLVECILSGVNVEKRKNELLMRRLDKNSEETSDIEQILDEEDAQEDEGLNVRDICRAAWGLSILGCSDLDTLGDVKVVDLLLALSLRVRELLLARLQLIRKEDLLFDPSKAHLSTEEILDDLAEELAEDAATAMWTFACAKACTGVQFVPLFETCSSILCQDPVDMRKRAQAADYELGVPIGTNDIVDRLARSETSDESVPESEAKGDVVETETEDKDALLDWLSPKEVNDVLWALALHGSSNSTSTSDDIMLSETASVLREIAFDRMMEWLEQDLSMSSSAEDSETKSELLMQDTASTNDSAVTVKVVDAATLLASEKESISGSSELPVETMALKASTSLQEVEVVDAAALLASIEEGNADQVEIETIKAPSIAESGAELREGDFPSDNAISDETEQSTLAGMEPRSRHVSIFSAHDLASMAWSVTELRDPLRVRIMGMIVDLIEQLGSTGTAGLSGGDMANLAWAISKYGDKLLEKDSKESDSLSSSVLSWIAHNAFQKVALNRKPEDVDSATSQLLHYFQPPEIGRLAWAIANTMSTYSELPLHVKRKSEIMDLLRLALDSAASNLSLFATEDLLRISWAFLEICGDEESMMDSSVANALGSILTTVEQSLHRWERGGSQRILSSSPRQGSDRSIFSSFFGKPRINHQLLEHLEGDIDDDDESILAPLIEKSKRPLLRDLTVDPSTLCKAACAFQRLCKKYPFMKGGWTITRVAVRLLSSKDARLMKECSIHDISRLCEATVLSDADGHGRELITGLFARRVLQVLNDVLDIEPDKTVESSIKLANASGPEKCSLLLSLGQLGAKHRLKDDAKHTAYKKMRLVSNTPLLSTDEVSSLDGSLSLKLLQGIVLLNFLSSDINFLLLVVKEVHRKAATLESNTELCVLAESVSVLKEGLESRRTEEIGESLKGKSVVQDVTSRETTDAIDQADHKESDIDLLSEAPISSDKVSVDETLHNLCNELLEFVASTARERIKTLSTEEIRRLLSVYSLLPFQADDLINNFSEEVNDRLCQLQHLSEESFESLLRKTKSKAVSVNTTLFGDENSDSPFSAIKNGIRSFFQGSEGSEDAEKKDENNLTDELISLIQESTASASNAANRAEKLRLSSGVSLDSMLQDLKLGTGFEVGRCNELIENYRRIEFSTGEQRSRYDRERTKDVAKRVLSRLLP